MQSALFELRTHASNHKPSPQGDEASHVMQYIAVSCQMAVSVGTHA